MSLSLAMAALSFVSTTTQKRITDAEIRKALLDDISIVSGSLEYINDLLKNMLDIHKTACNEMRLDIDSVNILEEIFEPVAKILVPRFGTVQTIIDCPPNLFAEIDRLRMKQVILNLAINASKFVDEGFIRLRAETIEEHTCIIVEDSGPGIPEHKRHQLFEKFQQSLDLNNQGTGIGLYVCKNLVGLMGGFIYLDESYRSEHLICPGSRFVIDLNQSPVYKPPSSCNGLVHGGHDSHGTEDDGHFSHSSIPSLVDQPMTMKHVLPLPEELTVLFVDDDAILRKLFARSIARVRPKWHIDHASHGEEALEMVETKKYELIFIDQYMASDKKKMLLGTETVPLMRRQAKKATCIICGLSANDLKDQFLDAGADAFMLKPFPCEKKALEQELIRVWGQGQEENVESSVAYVA